MKKLFYSLMLMAATLVVGCSEPDEPTPGGGGNGNNDFYGLEMEGVQIFEYDNDEYVIQMYKLASSEGTTFASAMASAHVTIPGVSDGVIPEGTYALRAGEKGDNPDYFKGSFYRDMYSSNPFDALLTGKLEVKHIAKGHRLTILSDGVNAETNATIKDLDFRYDGALPAQFISGEIPMISLYETYPEEMAPGTYPDPDIYYYGKYTEDTNLWKLNINSDLYEYQGYQMVDFFYIQLLTSSEATFSSGIPTGRYPINTSFEAGTALATYLDDEGYIDGSLFMWQTTDGMYADLNDYFFGGELNIVNKGNGYYDIDLLYYGSSSAPRVASFSGAFTTYDYTDGVDMVYYGDNNWQVYCWDMTNGICTALDVYSAEGNTFADGLAAGTYTVVETKEPMTIVPGVYDATAGAVDGSAFCNLSLSGIYDVVSSGTMEVSKEGDVYTVKLNLSGDTNIKDYTWECTGEVNMSDEVGDNTDPEEGGNTESTPEVDNDDNAAVLKAAPLKSAVAKKALARFSAVQNSGNIHKNGVVSFNRAF